MIDIHSHIIPAVDDGSSSMKESLEMLKIAWEDGVRAIVATPHIFSQISRIKDIEQLHHKFMELKKSAQDHHIEIEIMPGAEVFFVSDLREKLKTYWNVLNINYSNYFLLEFPGDMVFPGSEEYIFELVTDGFIPSICHPERNLVFQQNPHLLYQLLQAGALAQIDAGSLRGSYGLSAYSASMELLKHNLVHVIASDCHNQTFMVPGLSFVYKKLHGIEKEKIDLMVDKIPLAIVSNSDPPDIGPMIEPGNKKSFFDFITSVFK
jgi:protein-tyrosine phosphatase